jgi:uncharacterized protein
MAPIVSPESKFFWDAADQEKFVGEACGDCGRFAFPPRPMCPHCHSLNRKVEALSGKGVVMSWVMPLHPQAYGFALPPIVALVKLDEGINFVANLIGIELQDVRQGLSVEVAFEATKGQHKVPVFKPVAA